MPKKHIPQVKYRDRVVPIINPVKALNKKRAVSTGQVLMVVAKYFDRRLREWVLCLTGGGRYLAKYFRKFVESPKLARLRRMPPNRLFREACMVS